MKCTDFERWISDLVDGELPEAKGRTLEKHLLVCTSCQAYQRSLEILHEEVSGLDQPSAGKGYFQNFSDRLRAKLGTEIKPKKSRIFVDLGWKWTYTAAALALVAVMMIFLITPSRQFLQEEGIVVTSYEDAIKQIYSYIGEDSELEKLFNTVILASITAEVEDPSWTEGVDYADELDPLGGFTEKEIQLLKNIKVKREG